MALSARIVGLALPVWLLVVVPGCQLGTRRGPPDELLADGKARFEAKEFRSATGYFRGVTEGHPEAAEAEEALFLLAESYRRRQLSAESFRSYKDLLERYPASRFAIAVAMGEYQLGIDILEGRSSGFLFFRAPRTDGANVLEHMQIHFRNHAQADNALMRVADYRLSESEYVEAALILRRLLSEYPRSEFALRARFQLGRALWLTNRGPLYDARLMVDAQRAFEDFVGTVQMVGAQSAYVEQVKAAQEYLSEIHERLARKQYLIGRFYERTGYPESAVRHYEVCVRDFPGTEHAQESGKRLAKLRGGDAG